MDLEARVTALEDEVGILKGEIKSVLLEVRTAFLAQTNPFTSPQLSAPPPPAPVPAPSPPAPTPEPAAAPPPAAPMPSVNHVGSIQHIGFAPAPPEPDPGYPESDGYENADGGYSNGHQAGARPGPSQAPRPHPGTQARYAPQSQGGTRWQEPEPAYEPGPARRAAGPISRVGEPVFEDEEPVRQVMQPKFDMNTLAMLMAWTQGNMARLNLNEMGSLLALARYGGVIQKELEEILLRIASHFENEVDPRTGLNRQKPAATISEYLLALHELHTVINEDDEPAFRWLRKVG